MKLTFSNLWKATPYILDGIIVVVSFIVIFYAVQNADWDLTTWAFIASLGYLRLIMERFL